MRLNPELSKKAKKTVFSRKTKKLSHPTLVFNNNSVLQPSSQKHLGVTLDVKLTFVEHLNNVLNKVDKTIDLLHKLQNLLSRSTLITIYKAFVRPHLDYGDILYDQTCNSSLHEKLESIQYNACLALTRATRGSSKEKIYQELCFESLRVRRWHKKYYLFYKVLNNEPPQYLFNLIPVICLLYSIRSALNILLLNATTFLEIIFPSTVIKCNELDPGLIKAEILSVFKTNILNFTRSFPSSVYNCYNPKDLNLFLDLDLA